LSDSAKILFTSFFVVPGHSGGALLNELWEVVGMITEYGQPFSEAVTIDGVMKSTCRKRCKERGWLKRPFVPRDGYRLSLGVGPLFSTRGDAIPTDRFPSGRVSLQYRLLPVVAIHAGALRLAPRNLSVNGGLVGFGLTIPARARVFINPFLEGGLARVEGRYDAGGYFIEDGGKRQYVPFWNRVQRDGLGFGAGLSVQAILWPRTILEIVVARWEFNRPENAPRLPDFFVGGGLRLGI
jgi:hypothetical protein